ncbi:restriction endonuclease subunit S [Klebsiella quasipneumoniae]|uniref:restriction endonuclease subunit S n=1 Tax=Klebsiella quasipneumoniae TaxID=1463165 RepID=UPI0037BF3747
MAKYKAYPEYKDSGVEWLGVIPKGWTISKVKYLAPFQVGWTPPTKNDANFIGDNLWVNISDLKDKFISSTAKCISDKAAKEASMDITPRGSLLYSFKLSVGAVSFAGCDLYTNEAIASFLDQAQLPLSYLYYALPIFIIENASTNIYGAKILNQELIKNSFLLAPSHSEAKKVAQFLDHETAKIDNLIEKQQQLIELLKEKRQAVISHAVTKGLNPYVPMKDSGVEWLGEVPEHWEVKKLKHVAHIIDCKNRTPEYFDDGEYLVVRTTNVKKQSLVLDDALYTNERDFKIWTERGVPPVGSILFTREAPAGEICIVPAFTKLCMGQRMMNFICHQSNYTNFLFDYLTSDCLKRYIESEAAGSTVSHLRVEQVYNIPIVIPPNSEQKNIDEMVGVMKAQYSRLIDDAECSLVLLQERRNALISAAVTGKIDVRDWVAPDTKDIEEPEETTA